mgnify:CR=1 FL=1
MNINLLFEQKNQGDNCHHQHLNYVIFLESILDVCDVCWWKPHVKKEKNDKQFINSFEFSIPVLFFEKFKFMFVCLPFIHSFIWKQTNKNKKIIINKSGNIN